MVNNRIIFLALALALLSAGCSNQSPDAVQAFSMEVLAEGLDTPWAIDFLPDGRMIFTERPGRLNILEGKAVTKIADINITEIAESGLLGLAVDPEFADNHLIYLYYTYEDGGKPYNRVSSFELDNDKISNENVLLDNIPAAIFHDGGRIRFGPDGKLYITVGDATEPSSAQDIDSVSGKILRMNKDGTIPEDNPFGNYVYSYGHRNPEGMTWGNGMMYSSEHGPSSDDEVNIIEPGKNYGWPSPCSEPAANTEMPISCYSEFTLAPGSIAYHEGNLYVSGLRGAQLRKITLGDDGRAILKEEEAITGLGRVREVVSHDGFVYISTSNWDGRGIPRIGDDKILRIKWN